MYIERDNQGVIKGVYRQRQPGYAEEELPDDDPRVTEYLTRQQQKPRLTPEQKLAALGLTVEELKALLSQ